MQVVVDSGVDLCLPPEEAAILKIHTIPLTITLQGKSYKSGVDISPTEFYTKLSATKDFPLTSQPSPGVFVETYRRLAAVDPDILSVHISSGLSGTINAARIAAGLVPEAHVTVHDTKTLSAAAGWQALSAARAFAAGWPKEKVLELMKKISDAADSIFTLDELRYLVHGGRISHIKGLLASILNIKASIGVEKVGGTYVQLAQTRTFRQAIEGLVGHIGSQHSSGIALRAQVVHGQNPSGAKLLRELMDKRFKCNWLPLCAISPVLGAHTGPSVVGIAYAPESALAGTP